jgi:hypothetical protein
MNEEENYSYSSLIWYTQRALWQEIVPYFRGVAVEWKNDIIVLYFYIDGEISQELHDDCTSIGAEVIACYIKAKITEEIVRLDYPHLLPKHQHWVYRRKENLVESVEEENRDADQNLNYMALKATLGKISPQVRGIFFDRSNNQNKFLVYVDGSVQKQCIEDCEKIVDCFKRYSQKRATYETFRLDAPARLHSFPGWLDCIYLRKEGVV